MKFLLRRFKNKIEVFLFFKSQIQDPKSEIEPIPDPKSAII